MRSPEAIIPNSFILNSKNSTPTILLGYEKPSIFLMSFSPENFYDDIFQTEKINFPDSVQRSVRSRKSEFFYGRLCAKSALHQYGFLSAQVGIGRSREPVWPSGLVGAITHTKELAAAIALPASVCNGVGLDVEILSRTSALVGMQDIVASTRELSYLRSQNDLHGLDLLLLLVFSAKESFFKAVFGAVQDYFDFDAIEVVQVNWEDKTITFVVRQHLCKALEPGYICKAQFYIMKNNHLLTTFAW
ncbi:4'-phosphopantetheinyl transferase family protein [Janthinobacterium sp. GB4P2]|uniref:4'-phosphopantetheinyl transferase family protein n=1 Tax=Janthinobacterium sp. GB4P2 TaxID=3424189 RepID=UPI003F271374